MEIRIEKLGPCKAKVSIKIPSERVNEELENTYRHTANTVSFPGFRKGKTPKKLIIKRFGEIINEEVRTEKDPTQGRRKRDDTGTLQTLY